MSASRVSHEYPPRPIENCTDLEHQQGEQRGYSFCQGDEERSVDNQLERSTIDG